MDILIKNMNNKPKNCILEEHLSDGTVVKHEVVEVPEHGRLKDESVIIQNMEKAFSELFPIDGKHRQTIVSECHKAFLRAVFDAPTVLEAST